MTAADRRWTDPPDPDVWAAVVDSTAYAADHDDARSAATLTESGCDHTALAVAGIRFLASVLAEGIPGDDIREGVLLHASRINAPDLTVTSALETVALAEALTRDDWEALDTLISGSQVSVLDHAVMAAAISGQAIASVAGPDAPQVFERLRGAS